MNSRDAEILLDAELRRRALKNAWMEIQIYAGELPGPTKLREPLRTSTGVYQSIDSRGYPVPLESNVSSGRGYKAW